MLTKIDGKTVQSSEGWKLEIVDGLREDFTCTYSEGDDNLLRFGLYFITRHVKIYGCRWVFERSTGIKERIDLKKREQILERIKVACPIWLGSSPNGEVIGEPWNVSDESEEVDVTTPVVEFGGGMLKVELDRSHFALVPIELDTTQFGERCAHVRIPHIKLENGSRVGSIELATIMSAVTKYIAERYGYGVIFIKA